MAGDVKVWQPGSHLSEERGGEVADWSWRRTRRRIALLAGLALPYRARTTGALATLLAYTVVALAPPYLAKLAIDQGISENDLGRLSVLVALFLVAALAALVLSSANTYLTGWDPATNRHWISYEYPSGGTAASYRVDGSNAVCEYDLGDIVCTVPVERSDLEYPLIVESHLLRPDSGGPGYRRGGLGSRRTIRVASPGRVAATAARAGIGDETTIVVYDDTQGLYAARVWWTFRTYGAEHVRILDGGYPAWEAEGRDVERGTGESPPEPLTPFTPRGPNRLHLTTSDVRGLLGARHFRRHHRDQLFEIPALAEK